MTSAAATTLKTRSESTGKESKPRAKGKRDPGRDEALSEYLASLGGIPLLTADEEKDFARQLRDAETRCWQLLLTDDAAVRYLCGHPTLEDKKFTTSAALARHARRLQRAEHGQVRVTKRVQADIDEIAANLREFDDDRTLVEETLDVVQSNLGNKSRPIKLEKIRKQVVDDTRRERRRALKIRNQFVRANLRLVVSVARRFHHYRMPLIDLIQEGNLGLIKSVHRFDDRRGFRFSTYAHWWIRQAIERAIMNKGAQVRLPVHIFDARREIAKASHDLAQMLGRDPSKDELAEALGQPIDKIEEILKAVPREPVSLDDPVGDDEDRTVSETICDQDDATPDEKVISVDQASHVRHILRRLSPMEIDIIERRFGLVNDGNETLEEIGKSYNLSRERVRQIQVQGLKKMMRFCERRQLAV
jgi:RNA polymerase primary sigma factor